MSSVATVASAAASRAVALKYDERIACAVWTAESKADKANVLFQALAPIVSQYLVNGSYSADLKGTGTMVNLAAAIHSADKLPSGKKKPAARLRRDAAARAMFSHALNHKPRAFREDQAGHDAELEILETVFYAHLDTQAGKTKAAKPAAADTSADTSTASAESDAADDAQAAATASALVAADATADAFALVLTALQAGMLSDEQVSMLRAALPQAPVFEAPAVPAMSAALDAALAE